MKLTKTLDDREDICGDGQIKHNHSFTDTKPNVESHFRNDNHDDHFTSYGHHDFTTNYTSRNDDEDDDHHDWNR